MQTIFKQSQTYVRDSRGTQVREFGTVQAVDRGRVVMAVADTARRTSGIETFSPAHDLGWRLCG